MSKPNIDALIGGPKNKHSYTYKEVILKENFPLSQQMVEKNRKYVVKWNFDLDGTTVTVPANCVLEFDGGSINNGTLTLNGAVIDTPNVKIFENIDITVERSLTIRTSWFGFDDVATNGALFERCFSFVANFGELIVDKEVEIAGPITLMGDSGMEGRPYYYYPLIKGDDSSDIYNRGFYKGIKCKKVPSENEVLITAIGQGLNMSNIRIGWDFPNTGTDDGNGRIPCTLLKVETHSDRFPDLDTSFQSCYFNSESANTLLLDAYGRNLLVKNSIFRAAGNYWIGQGSYNPFIRNTSRGNRVETGNQFEGRGCIIDGNRFHDGGNKYCLELCQNPINPYDTFNEVQFINNNSDINAAPLKTDAIIDGLLFTNNVFLIGRSNGHLFEINNSVKDMIISDNLFKSRLMEGESFFMTTYVKLSEGKYFKNIRVSNNMCDIQRGNPFIFLQNVDGSNNIEVDNITVENNLFGNLCLWNSGISSTPSLITITNLNVHNISVKGNKSTKSQSSTSRNIQAVFAAPSASNRMTVSNAVIAFNEGIENIITAGGNKPNFHLDNVITNSDLLNNDSGQEPSEKNENLCKLVPLLSLLTRYGYDVTTETTNPEWDNVFTDNENRILAGTRVDGTVYIADL